MAFFKRELGTVERFEAALKLKQAERDKLAARLALAESAFAAGAFTVQSAAACDWTRLASTGQQTAAAATPAPQTQQAPAASQTSAVAAETTRKPVEEVVLVSDHR
jgi:hypothetical protein